MLKKRETERNLFYEYLKTIFQQRLREFNDASVAIMKTLYERTFIIRRYEYNWIKGAKCNCEIFYQTAEKLCN